MKAPSAPASIATLTLGQAPRTDILSVLETYLPSAQIDHFGLLDGMTGSEIEREYAPVTGEKVLISRLLDGTQVQLSAKRVELGVQQKINMLESKNYPVLLLLCTDSFQHLQAKDLLLLEPMRIITAAITAMIGKARLGIVLPLQEQVKEQHVKWKHLPTTSIYAVANPYQTDDDRLAHAAFELKSAGATVILLDCMGYNNNHKTIVQQASGLPVILSNQLVAKLAAEFLVL